METKTELPTGVSDGAPQRGDDVSLPKVLLVDDQPARLLTYEAVLEGLGVSCTRAQSGTQALERLLQETFAVIVLDVNMPDMDGFETARRIREHPRFEHTPIIFVTGINISDFDRLRGYEVGCIDYIPLPIVPEIFRGKIALLAELYKRRVQLQTLNRQLENARTQLEAERDDAVTRGRLYQNEAEDFRQRLRNNMYAVAAAGPEFDAIRSSTADLEPARGVLPEKEWLAALVDSMKEEVYFTDLQHRYVYANPAALREFGHNSLQGSQVESIVGDLEVMRGDGMPRSVDEAPPLRALAGEVVSDEEQTVRNPRTGELRHREVRAAPIRDSAGQIVGSFAIVKDVTDRKRAAQERALHESRSAALLQLTDMFRVLTDPAEIAYAAAELLGKTLNVSRCGYGTVDRDAETILIERDWNASGINSIAGLLHFREYGTYIEELKRGETVVCVDAVTDPRTAATAEALWKIQVRSFVNMPVIEREGTVALLYLTHEHARAWPDDELAFIKDVAQRTRVTVERRRHEQALAADLDCMARLRALSARVVSENSPKVLFDEILAAAVFIAKADGGSIQLLEAGSNDLVFAATRGLDPDLVGKFERISAKSGTSCGKALASNQRVMVRFGEDEGAEPDIAHRTHLAFGLKSAQSTPLISRTGRVIGMFSTHWRQVRVLQERELRFLDLLARQAADLIERQEVEQAMREAERRKDEFIAMLSHELRNPLVPIRNGISLLKNAPDPEGILSKVQPMMERQMLHTVRLIDDLMDVSRIASGRIELDRSLVTLEAIISSAVDAHRDQMSANRLDFQLEISEPRRQVDVDGTRLIQVLSNLLSNAIKFTAPGGRVHLHASFSDSDPSEPSHLVVKVRDTGAGLSADKLARIFELFGSATADNSNRSARSGLGVGLALARRLVELHGGTLQAFSEGPGRGAEFVFRIPSAGSAASTTVASRSEGSPLVDVRVLIVDDNVDGANSLQLLLKSMGLDAKAVNDGASAISLAASFKPQFVLLDIGMPGMDGHEVCRRLRAVHGNAMRILALTGWGQANDKMRALEAGFDAHLTKPADPDALAKILFGGGNDSVD